MTGVEALRQELDGKGFIVVEDVYSDAEIDEMLTVVNNADLDKDTFRKTNDLFAIRQFLKEVPDVKHLVFNDKLVALIRKLFGDGFFITKSIYFDKPPQSNWFVAYHQDLTISVDRKTELAGFGPWTVKQNQFAVQPPIDILQNSFTIRIHLDDTDEHNGALKVVPTSNQRGIYRAETIDWTKETEAICAVKKGGVMLMRPLLLHASSRTTNNKSRRVIHVEFSDQELPVAINWSERQSY